MAKGAGTGAAIRAGAALLLSLTALSIPGIGPVLAAGPIAALIAGAGGGAAGGGLVSGLTRLGVEDDDANTCAEGLKRGGTLVTVNPDDQRAALAVQVMRRMGAVEIDKRAAEWREGGWQGFAETETLRPHVTPDADDRRSEVTAEHEPVRAQSLTDAPRAEGAAQDEFTVPPPEVAIPIVTEELEVGKREVERGGVRVQKRVSEIPVQEDVTLREERINVDRRPADYTFHGSESEAFQESVVEIREAYEELLLNKKARVVEEVVIQKDVDEHTETVRETLRKTEVDIEPLEQGRARRRFDGRRRRPRAGHRAGAGRGVGRGRVLRPTRSRRPSGRHFQGRGRRILMKRERKLSAAVRALALGLTLCAFASAPASAQSNNTNNATTTREERRDDRREHDDDDRDWGWLGLLGLAGLLRLMPRKRVPVVHEDRDVRDDPRDVRDPDPRDRR